jgi:tetratricopeptide (TPR) repeat protein
MSSKGDRKPRSLAPQAPPKHLQGAAMVAAAEAQQLPPPSLFDLFYEEFLTQLMHNSDLAHRVPEEFIRLQTDIERVEYLLGTGAFIREFEVKSKFGIKSMEKTVQFRENGNQLFNSDQAMQSILYYNKALSFAPHPTYDAWLKKHPDDNFGREDVPKGAKQQPSKYEALALCYANRSAALRKLNQYDECIRDIARAARFGYPKENIYKLWERKGKCYMSLKRFDMAVKCLRQALQALKESALSDNQKTLKSHEIGGLIKDLRHVHGFVSLGGDDGSDHGSVEGAEGPLMGNTGPIIIVQETESQWSAAKKASTVTLPETSAIPVPPKPERRSFRRKKTPATGPATPLGTSAPASPLSSNGGGGDTASMGSDSNSSHQTLPGRQGMAHSSMSHSTHPPPGELNRANSQISISQISTTGIIPDIEVPVLSHGVNPRMPSASSSVEVRYTQDKGRFFVANQELSPGKRQSNLMQTSCFYEFFHFPTKHLYF